VPLVLGLVGLAAFILYELHFCKPPTVRRFTYYMGTPRQHFPLKGTHFVRLQLDCDQWLHPILPHGRGVGQP
jgi:hypothetical protein